MLSRTRLLLAAFVVAGLCAASAQAALTDSLKKGTPDIKSAGPLAFGPDGVLFIGDTQGAAVFAIDTGDSPAKTAGGAINIEGLDGKIASQLGIEANQLLITDLAINPASGNAYLSVMRGRGADAKPVILRIDRKTSKIDDVNLRDVKFAKIALAKTPTGDNPRSGRQQAITDLAYVNGKVIVAGLANEDFNSRLRVVPFPSTEADTGAGIEIYHGAHGKLETASPVRTFTAYDIAGETNILAAYTCTPLVRIPLGDLKPGAKVKGKTIAELGNRNQPLDMIVYQKDGKDYILLTNSARGVMKITTENIGNVESISSRISDKAGLKYDTIDALKGVEQMDKLDAGHALVLMKGPDGVTLKTIALP